MPETPPFATVEEDRQAIEYLRTRGILVPTCWGNERTCERDAVWVFSFAYEGVYCYEHFNALLLTFN